MEGKVLGINNTGPRDDKSGCLKSMNLVREGSRISLSANVQTPSPYTFDPNYPFYAAKLGSAFWDSFTEFSPDVSKIGVGVLLNVDIYFNSTPEVWIRAELSQSVSEEPGFPETDAGHIRMIGGPYDAGNGQNTRVHGTWRTDQPWPSTDEEITATPPTMVPPPPRRIDELKAKIEEIENDPDHDHHETLNELKAEIESIQEEDNG